MNNATNEIFSVMLKYMKKYKWIFFINNNLVSISCISTDIDKARKYIINLIKDIETKTNKLNTEINSIDKELDDIFNKEKSIGITMCDNTLMTGLQISKEILIKKRLNIISNFNANADINILNLYEYKLDLEIMINNQKMPLETFINNCMPEITNFNNISFD